MAGWRVSTRDDSWVVTPPDGSRLGGLLASGTVVPLYASRARALRALVAAVSGVDGLLPELWQSDAGIAFAEPTGPERDFSGVEWTWRNPAETLVPLMLQRVTAPGHDEAELAGFVTSIAASGDRTVHASGRFYDSEAGVAFRDLLLDGRRFGVSVDPGEETSAEWECLDYDDDGFCVSGRMSFTRYEIAGLTGTPFPGFARASIKLAAVAVEPERILVASGLSPSEVADFEQRTALLSVPPAAVDPARLLVASGAMVAPLAAVERLEPWQASALVRGIDDYLRSGPALVRSRSALRYEAPPAEWYRMPEPSLGGPGEELLVEQEDGTYGVPLTITDAGAVFGHVARWGQCHTGYPDECVQAPPSRTGYAGFHLGLTRLADGSSIPTGTLTAGCDHAAIRLRAPEAREHYDHSGTGWSTVRATDAALGIWTAGGLRPDVTDETADLLRSLSLSGDWRRDRGTGGLELLAVLGVNIPGFPQRRRALLASAGLPTSVVDQPLAWWEDDEIEALVASGIVRRPRCGCGEASSSSTRIAALEAQIEALTRLAIRRP